jgi:hypothetical protein
VTVNTNPQVGTPPSSATYDNFYVYCDGSLVTAGVPLVTSDFTFSYVLSGNTVNFSYTPTTFTSSVQFPKVEVSDNFTTQYRANVSEKVFGTATFTLSPATADTETPLRLWKAQSLQVVDSVTEVEKRTYANPLRADQNKGPGDTDWQRFFVRLPLDYGRNGEEWQKVALVCQNFAYWGSSVEPELTKGPSPLLEPKVYEELCLYPQPNIDYTYIYSEPYLYSNVAVTNFDDPDEYDNSNVLPSFEEPFDQFDEASLVPYSPLHEREANLSGEPGRGYGDWVGIYVNKSACGELSGYLVNDFVSESVTLVAPPVWDASVYKYAPLPDYELSSYDVDMNNYKLGYAYFTADASAAEEGCFDLEEETAWRFPSPEHQLYLVPGG